MVIVAVAGGTGGIGLTIVEAIIATKKHDLFVLSRVDSTSTFNLEGATLLRIDYSSPEAIAQTLKQNDIHTVLSALTSRTEEAHQSQLKLIEGAAKSGTVQHFAPSEFGLDNLEAAKINYPFFAIDYKNGAVAKLKEYPQLQYTRFINGCFMDYLGTPAVPSHLQMLTLLVDLVNDKAVVPGDGTAVVTFSHTTTVAAFVAAALDLEDWSEALFIRGQRIALNDAVATAEKVKGKKFDVAYDSVEKIKAGEITPLPSNVPRYQFVPQAILEGVIKMIHTAMIDGVLDPPGLDAGEVLPNVKPLTLEEFFKRSISRI